MTEHASARPQTTIEKIGTFLDIVRRAVKARDEGAPDSDKLENEARAAAYAAVKLIVKHKVELREPGAPPSPSSAPRPSAPSRPYATPGDIDDFLRRSGFAGGATGGGNPFDGFFREPPARQSRPKPAGVPFEGARGKARHGGACAVCLEGYDPDSDVLVSRDNRIAHADCGKQIPVTAEQLWLCHKGSCFSCSMCPTMPHANCEKGQALFRRTVDPRHHEPATPEDPRRYSAAYNDPQMAHEDLMWRQHHQKCRVCSTCPAIPHESCHEGKHLFHRLTERREEVARHARANARIEEEELRSPKPSRVRIAGAVWEGEVTVSIGGVELPLDEVTIRESGLRHGKTSKRRAYLDHRKDCSLCNSAVAPLTDGCATGSRLFEESL